MLRLTIRNDNLTRLLKQTKRTHTVDGKTQDQVTSCVLRDGPERVHTTSLVKDGVSSLSRFSTEYIDMGRDMGEGNFYITDIDTMLGALKYHGQTVRLSQVGHKITIFSKNKQTTLDASPDARAYPSNPRTLKEWEQSARDLAERIYLDHRFNDNYLYASDDVAIAPQFSFYGIDSTDLYEIFRCDSMNKQKKNEYKIGISPTFDSTDLELLISVGGDAKGSTTDMIEFKHSSGLMDNVSFTIKGGMEQLFAVVGGEVDMHILDFTAHEQGHKVLFDLGNGDFVFQSGLIR